MKIKNKLGGEKLMSIWWFFVIALVFVGVIFGVILFYGAEQDVRIQEAELLHEKIFDCLVKDNGFLNLNVLKEEFSVLNECGLNENLFGEGSKFFFKLEFYNNDSEELRQNILQGDNSLEKDCSIKSAIQVDFFPKCIDKNEVFLYSEEGVVKEGVLKILTTSNNHGGKF